MLPHVLFSQYINLDIHCMDLAFFFIIKFIYFIFFQKLYYYFFHLFLFWLNDNGFTILCWFPPKINMVYLCPLALEPLSHLPPHPTHLDFYRALVWDILWYGISVPISFFSKGTGILYFNKKFFLYVRKVHWSLVTFWALTRLWVMDAEAQKSLQFIDGENAYKEIIKFYTTSDEDEWYDKMENKSKHESE